MRTIKLLFFSLFIISIIFNGCSKKQETPKNEFSNQNIPDQSSFVKTKYGLWLIEGTVCKNIDKINRKAIEPGTEFQSDVSIQVFVFTEIGCNKPETTIYHRYSQYKEGANKEEGVWEEVIPIELKIKTKLFKTWSYINAFPGKYRVDILGPDKESIIKTYFFIVKDSKLKPNILSGDKNYDLTQLSLEASSVCEKIENYKPIGIGNKFTLSGSDENKKIWLWLKIKAQKYPTKIFVSWSKNIKSADNVDNWERESNYSLDIKGEIWDTKAVMDCTPGKWRVDILAQIMKQF